MTVLSITQLLGSQRLYCVSPDSTLHLLRTMEFAAQNNVLDTLVNRLNYICPQDSETILLHRDGRPEEMCFFWQQITRDEHTEALKQLEHPHYAREYPMPQRRTYHGGLICRMKETPINWSVHT